MLLREDPMPEREPESSYDQRELENLMARAVAVIGPNPADVLEKRIATSTERAVAFLRLGSEVARERALAADAEAAIAAITCYNEGRGGRPPPEQLAALERCIRFLRPAWILPAGMVAADCRDCSPALRRHIQQVAKSVAAIGFDRGEEPDLFGTGFLVGPSLLLTKNHVLKEILKRLRLPGDALPPGRAQAFFGLEKDCRFRRLDIKGVALSMPDLDAALLELERFPPNMSIDFATVERDPRLELGTEVVVVGHPVGDSVCRLFDAVVLDGHAPGLKRAAPGQVLRVRGDRFEHDCSTLGGNSGSPIISPSTGRVVGVHRSGSFGQANYALVSTALWRHRPLVARIGEDRYF